MLRITIEKAADMTLFILEGSLSGLWVTELDDAVMGSRSMPDFIQLDLTNVHFADEPGLLLIRQLMAWGVTLRAASPFILELLKADISENHAKK